jgi:hypothetical protein
MAQATLNIVVIPKRILKKTEAAAHCGRSIRRFEIECPVQPIQFPNGDLRYDVHDLDRWLDGLKSDMSECDMNNITERLK